MILKCSFILRFAELDKGQFRVAEYMTQLPSKKLLVHKLHRAIEIARGVTKEFEEK